MRISDWSSDVCSSDLPLHRGDLPSTIAVNAVLAVAGIYFLLPLVWVLIAATKSPGDLFASFGLWFSDSPQAWENLVALFTQDGGAFPRWVGNSILYSGVGAFVAMILSAACGYAIAKYASRGTEMLFSIILGGVLVPATDRKSTRLNSIH